MRTKRNVNADQLPVNQSSTLAQRQRKIKKFIRKIGNNPNNTLSNTNEANDKLNFKRSSNRSSNENTQDEIISSYADVGQSSVEKPRKRRIIVPIRRTRVNPSQLQSSTPSPPPPPSSTNDFESNESAENPNKSSTSSEQKKKLFVKRRRITPKPLQALEPSIIQSDASISLSSRTPTLNQRDHSIEDADIPDISLEIATRLATIQRTYTYVVTRVHDKQSEIISSTFVRDKIQTLTDTITHTIRNTDMMIQPTETIKFARTSIV